MYRNRARAAHVLQPSAPVIAQGSLPPAGDMAPPNQVPEQYPGYSTQPAGYNGVGEVSFFNPSTLNGHMEPQIFPQEISSKGNLILYFYGYFSNENIILPLRLMYIFMCQLSNNDKLLFCETTCLCPRNF